MAEVRAFARCASRPWPGPNPPSSEMLAAIERDHLACDGFRVDEEAHRGAKVLDGDGAAEQRGAAFMLEFLNALAAVGQDGAWADGVYPDIGAERARKHQGRRPQPGFG